MTANYRRYRVRPDTLLHALLEQMVHRGASDLHVLEQGGPVRYRINGTLVDSPTEHADQAGVLSEVFEPDQADAELLLMSLQATGSGLDFDAALDATVVLDDTGPVECRFRMTCWRPPSTGPAGSGFLVVRALPTEITDLTDFVDLPDAGTGLRLLFSEDAR